MKIKPDFVAKEISDKEIFRDLKFLVFNEKYLVGTYNYLSPLDIYANAHGSIIQYLEISTGKIRKLMPGKRYFSREAFYSGGKLIQGMDKWNVDEKLSDEEAAGQALEGKYHIGLAVINPETMKIEKTYSSETQGEDFGRLVFGAILEQNVSYSEEDGNKLVYVGKNKSGFRFFVTCYDLENKKIKFVNKLDDDATFWSSGGIIFYPQKQMILRLLMLPEAINDDQVLRMGYKKGWWKSKERVPNNPPHTRFRIKKIFDKFTPTLICNDFEGKELWREEIQDTLKEGDFFEHYDTGLFPSGDLWAVVQNNFLVYDIANHKKKFHHKAGTDKPIRKALEIKPGSLYALACDDNTIKFVDAKKGEVLKLTDIDYTANDLKAKGEKPESSDMKFYPDMIMWDTLDIINDSENKLLAVHPRLKNNILLLDLRKILKEIEGR